MKEAKNNFIRCPLCGNIFQKETEACRGSCPFNKTCRFICCPHCHYQFIDESKTLRLLKNLFGRRRTGKEAGQ